MAFCNRGESRIRTLFICVVRWDAWCLSRVEAALGWVNDWFSISQQRVEVALIVLYVVSGDFFGTLGWLTLLSKSMTGLLMYTLTCVPSYQRLQRRYRLAYVGLRISLQASCLCVTTIAVIGLLVQPHYIRHLWGYVTYWAYTAYFYSICIPTGGPGGRKRKRLLQAIQELWSAAWMPAPYPLPR